MKAAAMVSAAMVSALAAGAATGALPPPERASFVSLDRDASGDPVRVAALLFRPPGPAPQRGIDGERIALLGFSHGGSTTLAAIDARDNAVIAFRDVPDAPRFFRAAVAFYPGCRAFQAAGERWQPAMPARIYIGEKDGWTPAAPCVALGDARRGRGEPFAVTVYADSHHGFDSPAGRVVVRRNVPGGVSPGQGVTVGPNPEAGADARQQARAFLRERLAPAAAPHAQPRAD